MMDNLQPDEIIGGCLVAFFIGLGIGCLLSLDANANIGRADEVPKEVLQWAIQGSKTTNIDVDLILGISFVETSYERRSIGLQGEMGLLQIHPKYHVFDSANANEAGLLALKDVHKSCAVLQDAWFICHNLGASRALRLYRNNLAMARQTRYYKRVKEAYEAIRSRTVLSN